MYTILIIWALATFFDWLDKRHMKRIDRYMDELEEEDKQNSKKS